MTATEWLARLRWMCERVTYVSVLIAEGGEPSRSVGVASRSGTSDPTYAKAVARMEADARLRGELAYLEDAIGEALAVIEGARVALGEPCARTVELYYVTDEHPTWADVADEMGCSERLCYLRRDVFCDWLDDVGMERARDGAFT